MRQGGGRNQIFPSGNLAASAPAATTGAIPKSISFDKTVNEGGGGKGAGGDKSFFKSWKLPKIGGGGGKSGSGRGGGSSSSSNSREVVQ